MRTANLSDVKDRLSEFVQQAGRGTRIRILVRGVAVADLVPVEHADGESGWDADELDALERAGAIRRGRARARDARSPVDRPGPPVRGGKAVEVLLAERGRR